MELYGAWWNPTKNGEGFIFAQNPDAHDDEVLGYYYCHIGTTPVWYLLDLHWEGEDFLSGKVFAVTADTNATPGTPIAVTEDVVGSCTIMIHPDHTCNITLNINDEEIDYKIGSLFGTGFPTWKGEESEPAPVVDPPTPAPTPIKKIVQWDRIRGINNAGPAEDIGGDPYPNSPEHNPNVMYGSTPTDISDINPRATWAEYLLTVVHDAPNSIRLTSVNGNDDPQYDYNAAIEGVKKGDVLHPGDSKIVRLKLGPGSAPVGHWVQSNFFIDSDAGVLMNLSAQVADR